MDFGSKCTHKRFLIFSLEHTHMFLVKITLKVFGLEHTHWFLVKSTQYSYFVLVHAHTHTRFQVSGEK